MFTSLYIHVPFCAAKCAYCAFYSKASPTAEERRQYVAKLCGDLVRNARFCAPLDSIFVGGGTPSLLAPEEWTAIFDAIHGNFELSPDCEWSHEANPESLTPDLIELWSRNGVNRVSMGVQAVQEELRQTIGRHGSLDHLEQTVAQIRQAGIPRLNLDFIFNIPGQTLPQWRESLGKALELGATHVSAYALTYEEGARLKPQTENDLFNEFWDETDKTLAHKGIRRYEISNFAVPGQECRHNLNIWHGATYLGCGPAATSFDGTDRWTQAANLREWLKDAPPEMDRLPKEDRAAEILAFGMRVVRGWSWEEYQGRTGYDARELRGPQLQKLERMGLVALDGNGVKATELGLLFNDDVAMELL